MKPGRPKRNRGFTLIELLAASVLTAMLMTGLMSVVWSTVRQSNQLRQAEMDQASMTILAERLRIDFQNARGMTLAPDGVLLSGFLGPGLTEGRVSYQVRPIAIDKDSVERMLVRADSLGTQPIWLGVDSIRVQPLEIIQRDDDPATSEASMPEAAGGLAEVPASFRVTLIGRRGRILFREVIHHHDS